MAHFAQLDQFNTVIKVEIVNNNILLDNNGNESEENGIKYLKSIYGEETKWIQTSYNNNIRCRYAGPGMSYNTEHDVFLYPKPFPLWVLNLETYLWEPPVTEPELTEEQLESGSYYEWNEETQEWELKTAT
jgi:hypothetical protein